MFMYYLLSLYHNIYMIIVYYIIMHIIYIYIYILYSYGIILVELDLPAYVKRHKLSHMDIVPY